MKPMKSMKIILLALIAFTVPAHAQLRFGDIENKEVKEYIAMPSSYIGK